MITERELPAVISHFRLDRLLGSGGMGAVYHGMDRRDDTSVAVKIMHSQLAADPSFRERFEREAHVASLLRSPYTVRLLQYGRHEDSYFMAMEFIEGPTVKDLLDQGPLPLSRAIRIATQVARALQEAHGQGIVHRDIKPDNILIDGGETAKVADFGIAKMEGNASLTVAGAFIGTLSYASPEQLFGEADFRADIYSLGASLYHMLAGRPPFTGTVSEISLRIRTEAIPQEPLAGLPRGVVAVLLKSLEKDPEHRYQTAAEFAGALEFVSQHPNETVDDEAATIVDTSAPTVVETLRTVARETAPPTRAETVVSGQRVTGRLDTVGRGAYRLSITNAGTLPVTLTIECLGEDCLMEYPHAVTVGPGSSADFPVKVRAAHHRLFGSPQRHQFTITASGGGHGSEPPLTLAGEFEDRPRGLLIVAPVAALVVAGGLAGAVITATGGGGGDDGSVTSPVPGDATAPQGEPLKIGALMPLTGIEGVAVEQYVNAAQLAVDEINAAGGVHDRPLELVTADSQNQPDTAVEAARKLIEEDGVVAIVGDASSDVTLAVAERVTGPQQVLQITPSSASPELSSAADSDFLFRATLDDSAEGAVLAELARQDGVSKVCTVYVDEPYGQGMNAVFAEFGADLERTEVPHLRDQDTYAAQLDRCAGAQELVIMSFYQRGGQLLLQEARDRGFSAFLFADGMREKQVFSELGWESFDGSRGADIGVSHLAASDSFDDDYQAAFGEEVATPYLREAYDAVYLIALAAERAQSTASIAIRDSLREVANSPGQTVRPGSQGFQQAKEMLAAGGDVNYDGLSGTLDFDSNGDVTSGHVETWRVDAGVQQIRQKGIALVDLATKTVTNED